MKRSPLKRFTPLRSNSPFRPAAQTPGAERTEGVEPKVPAGYRGRSCVLETCGRPTAKYDPLCPAHRSRVARTGDPKEHVPISRTPRDRLEEKFIVDEQSGGNWTAQIDRHGYGRFNLRPRTTSAHRAAWLIYRGEIPEGTEIDHLCRNTRCVNPDHLEPVAPQVNVERSIGTPQASHCKRGHERTDENSFINGLGFKVCRTCHAEALRARDPALPKHGRSRMRPVSEKRAKEGASRTRAVRRLRALGDRCARCNSPYRLHGHERRGRGQGGDATQPDCLLCTVCNEWCESEPILAAWTGWKLSRKHPRNPSLASDQAIRTDGSIYTFPALEAA